MDCTFCHLEKGIVFESECWVAIEDAFPVNRGHTLLVTRRHVASFRELLLAEFGDLQLLLNTVVAYLDEAHRPDGYNFGVNDGAAAGQTIFHVHFHIIPRFSGDHPNPRGGVRNIKPPVILY